MNFGYIKYMREYLRKPFLETHILIVLIFTFCLTIVSIYTYVIDIMKLFGVVFSIIFFTIWLFLTIKNVKSNYKHYLLMKKEFNENGINNFKYKYLYNNNYDIFEKALKDYNKEKTLNYQRNNKINHLLRRVKCDNKLSYKYLV